MTKHDARSEGPPNADRGAPAETWFEGERLDPRLAQVVQRLWIDHGVRLGLAYGDCVAIARTALEESSAF